MGGDRRSKALSPSLSDVLASVKEAPDARTVRHVQLFYDVLR